MYAMKCYAMHRIARQGNVCIKINLTPKHSRTNRAKNSDHELMSLNHFFRVTMYVYIYIYIYIHIYIHENILEAFGDNGPEVES